MAENVALSLKQPWAALLVSGRKTIEVRSWPTKRRGRVLIHAARVPDEREYAWKLVPPELMATAKLGGGIIGVAELTDCITYRNLETFKADQKLHCNDPAWFEPPCMFGFRFARPEIAIFRRVAGNIRFFKVPEENGEAGETDWFSASPEKESGNGAGKATKTTRRRVEKRAEAEIVHQQSAVPIHPQYATALQTLMARFKAIREGEGLTLAVVAARLQIDALTLYRLESGKILDPTLTILHQWAEALGQSLKIDLTSA